MTNQMREDRDNRNGGNALELLTLTDISTSSLQASKLSFADQTYTNIYGTRYSNIQLMISFKLEDRGRFQRAAASFLGDIGNGSRA